MSKFIIEVNSKYTINEKKKKSHFVQNLSFCQPYHKKGFIAEAQPKGCNIHLWFWVHFSPTSTSSRRKSKHEVDSQGE